MNEVDLNVTYVYIVNSDLKMSKGKIAAQVSHVAMLLQKWFKKPVGKAIVLKADEETLKRFLKFKKQVKYIKDAGLTQVPRGSLTCIGFIQNEFFEKITKTLKLM